LKPPPPTSPLPTLGLLYPPPFSFCRLVFFFPISPQSPEFCDPFFQHGFSHNVPCPSFQFHAGLRPAPPVPCVAVCWRCFTHPPHTSARTVYSIFHPFSSPRRRAPHFFALPSHPGTPPHPCRSDCVFFFEHFSCARRQPFPFICGFFFLLSTGRTHFAFRFYLAPVWAPFHSLTLSQNKQTTLFCPSVPTSGLFSLFSSIVIVTLPPCFPYTPMPIF